MENKKIKIAEIIGKYVGGGVEEIVYNYTSNLDKDIFQIDFIIDEDSLFIPKEKIEKAGINIIIVPPYQKVWDYQKKLIKIFKENKYDIVHSHINALSVFPLRVAKKAGIKVRIAHSHSTTNPKEKKKNLLKLVLRKFSKLYSTDYMACTEFAGRWLFGDKTFENCEVYVLNNAINIDKYQFDLEKRNSKRKELGLDDKTFVLGHIGRFVAQKNHSKLVDIFYEFQKNNKNSKLLLVGQGPLMDSIKNKIKLLNIEDKVMFLGQREDVNELYLAFDCFVFPSLYEGLGMVVIEAQCSGLPCIASSEVPNVTNITNLVTFVSLEDSNEKWCNEIKRIKNDRKNYIKEIKESGYDINLETKKLMDYYITKCNRG